MDVEGEFLLPAPPGDVWRSLNDPEVLVRCIPGCQRMTRIDAENFECEILLSYGPIKATFMTVLVLSNVRAPDSYTLTGRSQGGLSGVGEGVADVWLMSVHSGTSLRYAARLSASGRIARIGARWLNGATRRMTEKFFNAFAATFGEG
ncbi:MAG: carbon monoxide dehydrogenase subunit G [Gammaproteobacteria bacterium]|nr:carbon monoxide dehydrogenase subunit G [Gammaproteobacteria bacterium]